MEADKIERGMLLVNPHNKPGYTHKGRFFVPHHVVMKITKHRIMFDDYTSVPKRDEQGNLLQYVIAQ